MDTFRITVRRELTADERKKLEVAGCRVHPGSGNYPDSPAELTEWTHVDVPADDPRQARDRIAELLGIDPGELTLHDRT